MASNESTTIDEQPQAFDAKKLEPAKKRKRPDGSEDNGRTPSRQRLSPNPAARPSEKRMNDPAPRPSQAASPSSQGPSGTSSPAPVSRLKRPGQRARISEADRERIGQRAADRQHPLASTPNSNRTPNSSFSSAPPDRRHINDVVKAHYNAVPERGRDWRKTDSRIKGLRSMNNWVKSTIIQKFSPDEDLQGESAQVIANAKPLLVLDIGCGKGGDLGKWAQAPQPVELYVGLDPADVSIEQARDRYRSMGGGGGGGRGDGYRGGRGRNSRLFEARFQIKDCFGESIQDVDIVRQVGFSTSLVNHNPERGFDIVSMMFCMHYAFETEEKARRMLQNVAGALKKGGRFIGTIPDSDVISERVRLFEDVEAKRRKRKIESSQGDEEIGSASHQTSNSAEPQGSADGKDAPSSGTAKDTNDTLEEGEAEETAEWGNDIYRVRFPGATPTDGIFRPPFGWKYNFYLAEAVETVPEYVVPWEAFRALAEDYNLELQYKRPFREIWQAERDDPVLGPLSERMGVRDRRDGHLLVSEEEMQAAGFYIGFCFYKV
jgi:mRNA (guanine-N7-)-methyltransferase